MDQQQLQQAQMMQQPVKTVIGTEEAKEIVQRLNSKPFNENYSLVSFDELSTMELLDLLNKILSHLDKSFETIREKPQEQIIFEVAQFIKILNFPVPNPPQDINWQNGLFSGDKRVMYPVLYYLLTRLSELEKRAYLAKFLVPFNIPEELAMDEELKQYLEQYKDLQAQFQVHHQQFEQIEKEKMNPGELKKEITQLEQEREQLNSKINIFKNKNTNKPEFQQLLDETNLLRKEQEEEARIQDKLRQQRQQFEWTDQQLLASQQRLMDCKKSMSPDNTPEQMLQSLRNDVKKNRELCADRLAIEINEKRKKLEQTEKLLQDPPITQNEINQMESNVVVLRRAINIMEEKLSKQANPQDDKLAIYKQQAALVAKKKEKALEEQKRAEEEMRTMEQEIQKKEDKIAKEKGPGFKSKDDFNQYATDLRAKTNKYKKMKDELKEVKNEVILLSRTEQILKQRYDQYDQMLKQSEQKNGIMGFSENQKHLEEISEKKQGIDEQKGKTLEDISKFVKEIEQKLKDKKVQLQPQIQALKDLRQKFQNIDQTYKQKKTDYDKVMLGSESEITNLESEVKKLKDEVYKEDSKLSILKFNSQILDLKINRLNEEAEYQKGTKTLNNESKTYSQFFEQKCAKLEGEIKELRKQRELVKENHEPSLRQQTMFTDLKKLLSLKLQTIQSGASGQIVQQKRGDSEYGNVNRLVINQEY